MQIHLRNDGKHGKKWAGHLDYGFHPLDRTINLGYGGGWSRKTAHQSYHPRNSEKVSEKTRPTSNVIRHSKSIAIDLFFVTEDIVCNEGTTKTGRGCGTSWVTNHKWARGKCGGGLSGVCVLGNTRRYLLALQQSVFTRISTRKIHISKKCPASGNQNGSHVWQTGM